MPRGNAEILRAALGRALEDPEAFYSILDPEIEWDQTAQWPDAGGSVVGVPAVREFFRSWVGAFEEFSFDIEEMIETGDSVFVSMHQHGVGKSSGVGVDQSFAQVWTFRDGRVIRFKAYSSRAAALEAAGLAE